MTWAPWRPFSGKTRLGGPSGRKPRRGRDGCRVPAGILFLSPRSCRSPAWRVCSSQSGPSSSKAASGLATPLPAAGETEARAVEWGEVLSLCALTRPLGGGPASARTSARCFLQRRWVCVGGGHSVTHDPSLRHVPSQSRTGRPAPHPAGTRERAGLECPRQAALAGRGAVRRPAAREPVTALGCPLSWEWL